MVIETSAPPLTAAPMAGYPKNAESARTRGIGCGSASLPDVVAGMAAAARMRPTVVRVSAIIRAAPREEPQDPFLSCCPTITGAVALAVMVVIREFKPRTPE